MCFWTDALCAHSTGQVLLNHQWHRGVQGRVISAGKRRVGFVSKFQMTWKSQLWTLALWGRSLFPSWAQKPQGLQVLELCSKKNFHSKVWEKLLLPADLPQAPQGPFLIIPWTLFGCVYASECWEVPEVTLCRDLQLKKDSSPGTEWGAQGSSLGQQLGRAMEIIAEGQHCWDHKWWFQRQNQPCTGRMLL